MSLCITDFPLGGYGALYQYRHPYSGLWVVVRGSQDVDGPEKSRQDPLDISSGEFPWAVLIPSFFKQLEPISLEVDLYEAQWRDLHRFFDENLTFAWRFILTQLERQPTTQFCAFIQSLPASFPLRDKARMTVNLQPSGRPEEYDLNPL